jgi:N-acetylmuramic acid 6-phosphate etherase
MANTEASSPDQRPVDQLPMDEAVRAMWKGQADAIAAMEPCLPKLAKACEEMAKRLDRSTGRIIYAGAGTSIRIAVQDGVELGPTFGWPEGRLAYVIAGGPSALLASAEGAEDDAADAVAQVQALALTPNDILIGVAASGRTPFTIAAVEAARTAGAYTIAIANNEGSPLAAAAEIALTAATGAELVTGSTRMKAGTAQKAILNLLSTGTMIRLGHVIDGEMVSMIISNEKLLARGIRIVAKLAAVSDEEAAAALNHAGNDIKAAIALAKTPDHAA